jgi:hypothetical protein
MKIEEAIQKFKFMKNGYQKLIDENCSEGEVVGTDVTGTWKSDMPPTEVYQAHVDACDMAIKALDEKSTEPVGCDGCIWDNSNGELLECRLCSRIHLDRYVNGETI